MALLINTARARSIIEYSSPSFALESGLHAVHRAINSKRERLAEQGKTFDNCVGRAVLDGASSGLAVGSLASIPLTLSSALRAKVGLPQWGVLGAPHMLRNGGICMMAASAVRTFVCTPLLDAAEELKDAPCQLGNAVQTLAFAAQAAALWFTEVPCLAFSCVFLSCSIVCGAIGAVGGLLLYGGAKELAMWWPNNEGTDPSGPKPCLDSGAAPTRHPSSL